MKKLLIAVAQLLVFSSVIPAKPPNAAVLAAEEPELGKWWKKSDIVNKLQLSEDQVGRIEQTFLRHRPSLANLSQELQKCEFELRTMMQADPIDESKILTQTELVAQSRAALEKANASMLLNIRKDLTKVQWNMLQEIQALRRASGIGVSPPPRPPMRPPLPPRLVRRPPIFPEIDRTQTGEKVYHPGKDPIKPPSVLYQPLPRYTQEARDARVEGVILVQGVVRKTGRVDNMTVLRGLGYGLDERALETLATEWRFEPGTLNGQPVDVQVSIEISFRLF